MSKRKRARIAKAQSSSKVRAKAARGRISGHRQARTNSNPHPEISGCAHDGAVPRVDVGELIAKKLAYQIPPQSQRTAPSCEAPSTQCPTFLERREGRSLPLRYRSCAQAIRHHRSPYPQAYC
jgi:hypothetical protein